MTTGVTDSGMVFGAMGAMVSLRLIGPSRGEAERLLSAVEALFRREEARFSRFRPDSELSRLNADGRLDCPTEEMWEVLHRADRWRIATDGWFDAATLPALEAAGYDRSLELVGGGRDPHKSRPRPAVSGAGPRIVFEADGGGALADGVTRIDLGGLVKGWTVDRAAELLVERVDGYMVDAGGDIRAGGAAPRGDAWLVGVQDPRAGRLDQDVLPAAGGGVATSGTYRRRWRSAGGRMAHHLIDPRTGEPSRSGVVAATVVAESAEAADVLAKYACLRGLDAGVHMLEVRRGTEGLLTGGDGTRLATRGWGGLVYRTGCGGSEAGAAA